MAIAFTRHTTLLRFFLLLPLLLLQMCADGGQLSEAALQQLADAAYTGVVKLQGGYAGWGEVRPYLRTAACTCHRHRFVWLAPLLAFHSVLSCLSQPSCITSRSSSGCVETILPCQCSQYAVRNATFEPKQVSMYTCSGMDRDKGLFCSFELSVVLKMFSQQSLTRTAVQ